MLRADWRLVLIAVAAWLLLDQLSWRIRSRPNEYLVSLGVLSTVVTAIVSTIAAVGVLVWRRHQSAVWLKKGQPRPVWVFASTAGTPLDESNVRKAHNLILDKAGLHRRGPHQMRHTFGSLLINVGEPVTYVSRQLGHKDSAITLKVYARWLQDDSRRRGVESPR